MKNKKALWITLIVLDVLITGFLFVISIIMLASTVGLEPGSVPDTSTFIGYLQANTNVYLGAFVIPLFVLLAANIVGLVIYVRKTTKREPVTVNDLSADQMEALKAELLKDLAGGNKPAEEEKAEEPKPEEAPTEEKPQD
ncbi:MAG: hypothetical protein K6B65_00780 [Bacilli bacterium]|nr:hypothetical protein [Bacilli bacterium]